MENLAIVILSYNHQQLTTECVESVLEISPSIPIYLIHNGTDKKQKENLYKKFTHENITHLSMEENRGFSGGANYGLSVALKKHPWVLFLTNDTHLKELPSSWKNFQLEPGQYAPLIRIKRNQKIDSLGGALTPRLGHLFHIKEDKSFENIQTKSKNTYVYVPGTAFLIDAQTYFNSSGFDEKLGTYWEDVDYSLALQKQNCKVGFTKNFIIEHKVGKTCHKDTYYTTFLFHRNRLVISWKYASSLERLYFLLVLSKDILKRFYRDSKNKNIPSFKLYLKALLQGVKMIIADKKTP